LPEDFLVDERVFANYYKDPQNTRISKKYQDDKDFYAFVFDSINNKPFHFELRFKPRLSENSQELIEKLDPVVVENVRTMLLDKFKAINLKDYVCQDGDSEKKIFVFTISDKEDA
jgi:hypothetical protein